MPLDVVLVQPPIGGNVEDVSPPLGLLCLGAALAPDGHKTKVVDLNLMMKTGAFDARKHLATQLSNALPKKKVGLLGVTTWSYNFDVTMELVLAARAKHPRAPIVLGGPHVTFVDQDVLSTFREVDFVLRDEGDLTFPRLARAIEKGDAAELAAIPGLTWRRGDEVVRNPSGPVVEDLDALPYPDFDLVDAREYVACSPVVFVEAGRGCPYNCNFCSTTNMFQRRYRVKSPKRLVDEVVAIAAKIRHDRFELLHDNLVASRAHVSALCRELRDRNLELTWSCTSRPDNMTPELAHEMFLAGCVSVFYGVETMDEARQRWTGKKCKPAAIESAVAALARTHVKPSCGIIVGFPDETPAELDATVSAALRWTVDHQAYISTASLRFYPGADLFGLSSQLHYDRVAEADNAAIGGLRLREEWRTLPRLFPLNMVHTPPDETRRVLLVRNFTRALLRLCPFTFRACVDVLGIAPHDLFARMAGAREFRHLDEPSRELAWNEAIWALAAVLEREGAGANEPKANSPHAEMASTVALELLSHEVPFWRTTPVVGRLDSLEHVIHPKRYEPASLVEVARLARKEPVEVAGQFLLSVRGGTECLVWVTPDPEKALDAFRRSWARDPRGTIAQLAGLRRGLG